MDVLILSPSAESYMMLAYCPSQEPHTATTVLGD